MLDVLLLLLLMLVISEMARRRTETGQITLNEIRYGEIAGRVNELVEDLDAVHDYEFHGETCFTGILEERGFRIPVYFLESAKNQVCFSVNQPVEVTGIVRWSPPYSPGGAHSLSLAVRVAALWLR